MRAWQGTPSRCQTPVWTDKITVVQVITQTQCVIWYGCLILVCLLAAGATLLSVSESGTALKVAQLPLENITCSYQERLHNVHGLLSLVTFWDFSISFPIGRTYPQSYSTNSNYICRPPSTYYYFFLTWLYQVHTPPFTRVFTPSFPRSPPEGPWGDSSGPPPPAPGPCRGCGLPAGVALRGGPARLGAAGLPLAAAAGSALGRGARSAELALPGPRSAGGGSGGGGGPPLDSPSSRQPGDPPRPPPAPCRLPSCSFLPPLPPRTRPVGAAGSPRREVWAPPSPRCCCSPWGSASSPTARRGAKPPRCEYRAGMGTGMGDTRAGKVVGREVPGGCRPLTPLSRPPAACGAPPTWAPGGCPTSARSCGSSSTWWWTRPSRRTSSGPAPWRTSPAPPWGSPPSRRGSCASPATTATSPGPPATNVSPPGGGGGGGAGGVWLRGSHEVNVGSCDQESPFRCLSTAYALGDVLIAGFVTALRKLRCIHARPALKSDAFSVRLSVALEVCQIFAVLNLVFMPFLGQMEPSLPYSCTWERNFLRYRHEEKPSCVPP